MDLDPDDTSSGFSNGPYIHDALTHPFIHSHLSPLLSSSLSQLHSFSWPAYKKLLGATGGETERQSKEVAQAALVAKLAAIQEVRLACHVMTHRTW